MVSVLTVCVVCGIASCMFKSLASALRQSGPSARLAGEGGASGEEGGVDAVDAGSPEEGLCRLSS